MECKLGQNEPFRDIFHPGNVRGMENPKKNNGSQMCLWFHTSGYCFDDCNCKSGHGNLKLDETEDLKKFTGKTKYNIGQLQTRSRGGNDNWDITPNNNPAGNATSAAR